MKSPNKGIKSICLANWQIGIILSVILLLGGYFLHFNLIVVEIKDAVTESKDAVIEGKDAVIEGKDAVIEGKETTIDLLTKQLYNYEYNNRMLVEQNKELRNICEKRNATSPFPSIIPVWNVSKHT